MIIYLDDYRKPKAIKATMNTAYEDELLCVNWNPAVAVTPISMTRAASAEDPEFIDTEILDTEEFMAQTYALATQI